MYKKMFPFSPLRFIVAGACAPNFLLGTIKAQKKEHSEATKVGF